MNPVPSAVVPPASPPPARWSERHPLMAMLLDFALAALILFAVVFLASFGWGLWQTVQAMRHSGGMAAGIAQPGLAFLLLASSLATLMAALALYFLRRRASVAERIHSRAAIRQPRTWLEAIAFGVVLFIAGSVLMYGLEVTNQAPEPSNLPMVQALFAYDPVLLWLLVVVVAPFAEELLFRRVLFGRLWAAGKPGVGMVASGLLFALMHELPGFSAAPWPGVLWLLSFYTAMGMAFAAIYRRTGTLWAAVIAHAVNNALGCAMLMMDGFNAG
ncbi:CPBP family intramembrane metalloprotease [Lysobacter pythonis]|uniref:CPBP family intramembrane metalloprotease n=1 Tax=Solilutibacter pythonis TaxID=2483112 RepID=A0A3M2I0D7_9GAMM|nr:CPBP family intramembrane glutamic endopeptidase [Lysobacter pythonis]RMH93855.1 CPBP family intramembrane metalloprotease [Lysobacter pythonis]